MVVRVTDDKKYLQIIDGSQNEIEQVEYSFTKKVNNYFIIKKKIPHWDGEIKFIDKYLRIPIGLWRELEKLCKKFHIPFKIEGIENLYDESYNEKEFKSWVADYFKDSEIKPREYQIEAASKVLKYRNCTEEISTSAGKTLISFMIFKYLFDKKGNKKMLYVVPNINLVTQTEEKFYAYEDSLGKRPNWKSECAFGGAKKKDDIIPDIVFGTYQTLSKKDDEYFEKFDAVCIDETHHARSASIQKIVVKCVNAQYNFGLTGTLPEADSCDSFTIQSYLGPKVYDLTSADLIDAGHATPIHVISMELDYLDKETRKKLFDLRNVSAEEKDGAKLLNLEKDIARESRKRFNYILETIVKTSKNSLVLFSDIKNEYGRRIYNWLRENTEKNVYYIDGGTSDDHREYYKKKMEKEENTIIVASVGVFGEGIDILNVHNLFIVESYKSQFIVRQILGRGMRLMTGKEKVLVIDFCDNYEYGSGYQRKNYLMRHADEREKICKEKKFPYKRYKIDLN